MNTRILATALVFPALLTLSTPAHRATVTFEIHNQQTESLGLVTITALGGDAEIVVPGLTDTTITLPGNALSVTICGQDVSQGVTGYVTLASTKEVEVHWPSSNKVIVIDEEILGR